MGHLGRWATRLNDGWCEDVLPEKLYAEFLLLRPCDLTVGENCRRLPGIIPQSHLDPEAFSQTVDIADAAAILADIQERSLTSNNRLFTDGLISDIVLFENLGRLSEVFSIFHC